MRKPRNLSKQGIEEKRNDIYKQEVIKIVKSDTAPLSCNTCIFLVKKMYSSGAGFYERPHGSGAGFYERPYCKITDEYLDTELGTEICEVFYFIKKLLEMI